MNAVPGFGDARYDSGRFAPSPPRTPEAALQRVVVRMLFDSDFARRVLERPEESLSEHGIPAALLRQLASLDGRLFRADRQRPLRAMKTLAAEYKATVALVLDASGRWALLMDFFKHGTFHDGVQNRGFMALAFARYLRELLPSLPRHRRRIGQILLLEEAMAVERRMAMEWRRAPGALLGDAEDGHLVLAPGTGVVRVSSGTLATVHAVERFLFEASEVPALVLCEDAPRPERLPPLGDGEWEHYLLETGDAGRVQMSALDRDYFEVASAFRFPAAPSALPPSVPAARAAALRDALRDAGVLAPAGALRAPRSGNP